MRADYKELCSVLKIKYTPLAGFQERLKKQPVEAI